MKKIYNDSSRIRFLKKESKKGLAIATSPFGLPFLGKPVTLILNGG
ncbi:hypothetical protein [uncultured Megasphaera sp.]|nr:hypothetical protein [uncultured Megasphaera sp.]